MNLSTDHTAEDLKMFKFKHNGKVMTGRVVGTRDSDPRCAIWVCDVENPDDGYFISESDIIEYL